MSLAQTDYTAADGRDCRGCLHVRVDIDTGWLVCQEPVIREPGSDDVPLTGRPKLGVMEALLVPPSSTERTGSRS